MWRAGIRVAWLAIVCLGACRFDGGGVPLDGTTADAGGEDGPEPPPDATVDAPVADAGIDATVCPAGYVDLGVPGSRYRIGPAANWQQAERACEDDSGGVSTHLVVLDSAAELAAIDPRVTQAWVGLSDRRVENDFLAVTGGHPLFQPWAPGEPNDAFGEDCAELDGTALNDEECNNRELFVCECDGRPADPTTY